MNLDDSYLDYLLVRQTPGLQETMDQQEFDQGPEAIPQEFQEKKPAPPIDIPEGQAGMTSFDPTARQNLADFLQAGFEAFGMDRYRARRTAQSIMGGESSNLPLTAGLADIIPFIGTALQGQEGVRMLEPVPGQIERGEYAGAAANVAGAALNLLPGAVSTVKGAKQLKSAVRSSAAPVKVEKQ